MIDLSQQVVKRQHVRFVVQIVQIALMVKSDTLEGVYIFSVYPCEFCYKSVRSEVFHGR
jgi:hypothetical protein